MIRRRTVLAACLCGVGTIIAGLPVGADEGYLLRRAPKQGELDRYRITLHVAGEATRKDGRRAPVSIDVEMNSADVVKSVKADGSYVVATTIESGVAKVDGTESKIPTNGQALETTFDRNGTVLKRDAGGGQAGNMAQMLGMTRMGWAPDRRVKAGEEVPYDIPLGDEPRPRRIAGSITIVGIEKATGDLPVDTLAIKNVGEMTVPGSDEKLHLDVTTHLRPDDARVYRTEGTLTNVHFGPITGAKITFKVDRLGP